jgi:hypothetical protein
MNKSTLTKVYLVILLAAGSLAHAEPDNTSPYINPNRTCITDGMNTPEGKAYRFLYSRDCSVVYALPPPVMYQNIKSQGVNLEACSSMKEAKKSNDTLSKIISEGRNRLSIYEEQLEKATSKSEEQRLQAKINDLNNRLEKYQKVSAEADANYEKNFGQVPGAVFSIVLDSDVSQNDLNNLRGMNNSNLHPIRWVDDYVKDENGNRKFTGRHAEADNYTLRTAPVQYSIFSFIYNVPADATHNGGIISTDIPNLQYLEQSPEGGTPHTGVIHVQSNGGVSGKVIMSLTTACDKTKADESGRLKLDEDTDPFFTVNRTFEVQQMYAQGYEASLKVNKVVDSIISNVSHDKGNTFEKFQAFTPVITANISDILDFHWIDERANTESSKFKDVLIVQQAVAAKLVDSYLDDLVKAGIIEIQKIPSIENAKGGYVDETRVGTRCWSERNGGLSGFFGGSHQACGNYTYSVKVWKDGVTVQDVRSSLTLNAVKSDRMIADTMAPFRYTTAFVKAEKRKE